MKELSKLGFPSRSASDNKLFLNLLPPTKRCLKLDCVERCIAISKK